MLKTSQITTYRDDRGTICIAEVGKEVPFAIDGISVLYGTGTQTVPRGALQVLVIKGQATVQVGAVIEAVEVDQCVTAAGPAIIKAGAPDDIVLVLTEEEQTSAGAIDLGQTKEYFTKKVERAFYLKDVICGQERGGHAHQYCHQSLICLKGSLDVVLDNGSTVEVVHLSKGSGQLHIPPFIWAKEQDFSPGAICLVLASHPYNRAGYMDTIEEMKQIRDEVQ